jgi:hypothetical protein
MRPPSFAPVLPMKIESVRSLRGPNLWSDQTVLEAIATLGADETRAQATRVAERALSIQLAVGAAVSFCATRPMPGSQCRLLVQFVEEEVGKKALELAVDQPLDLPLEQLSGLAQLRALAEEIRLGPSTGAIVRAAEPAASRLAGSPKAAWFSSVTGRGAVASGLPKPTRPAPSAKPLRRTRSSPKRC